MNQPAQRATERRFSAWSLWLFAAGISLFVLGWIGIAALIPGGVLLAVGGSTVCFVLGVVLGLLGLWRDRGSRVWAFLAVLLNSRGLFLASRNFLWGL